jgi:Thiamine pyrophosphate enzyme, N-terminal TPP binding domain
LRSELRRAASLAGRNDPDSLRAPMPIESRVPEAPCPATPPSPIASSGRSRATGTLLVPGLAEALEASIPVVAIVQDLRRDQTDRNAFQDLEHIALLQGCARQVLRVPTAGRIDDYVDLACTAAAADRCRSRPRPMGKARSP